MTDKMRDDFEAAFAQHQVDLFGEGYRGSAIHLLKRNGDFDMSPTHYELQRREQGLYDLHWVEMTYWAWQASRESLVIELPPAPPVPSEPEDAIDDSHMDGYNAAVRMRSACEKSIKAAGLKVKP